MKKKSKQLVLPGPGCHSVVENLQNFTTIFLDHFGTNKWSQKMGTAKGGSNAQYGGSNYLSAELKGAANFLVPTSLILDPLTSILVPHLTVPIGTAN